MLSETLELNQTLTKLYYRCNIILCWLNNWLQFNFITGITPSPYDPGMELLLSAISRHKSLREIELGDY